MKNLNFQKILEVSKEYSDYFFKKEIVKIDLSY